MSRLERVETGLGEECGVFGAYDIDGHDVASSVYYGLFALQHRGQESCGIAVTDTCGKRKVLFKKDLGLVNEVLDEESLTNLKGNLGVGHVRYSTAGGSRAENAQPLVINYVKGTLAIAHNGNLTNAVELRKELEYTGAIFQTTIDSEVIAYHIARERLKTGKAEDAASGLEAVVAASEEDDFLLAMKQVTPLQGKGRDVPPAVAQSTPPPSADTSLQDFLDGKLEFALSMTDEYMEGHVVGLDQMIMNKLRAGGLSPEAHLDLHGLNAQQAFETLRGFMRGSWYKGLRTILVVPGRGKNSPDGVGVLRGKLQSWLTQDPFKRVVLAFCTAQPHDGGPGSVYVLLRKYKKKGRVYWERMPADADLYE